MTGSILRGIGSFYTVLCDEDGQEYTLRAQKKLRHQKMTPMVGDRVRFTPGQGGEDGWLEEILPRKSMMERPSVANVDMLMLVIASVPQPDMLLCDKLILRAEKGGMIPAICVNKIDLGDELAEQIRREYVGTQLRVFSVSAHEGTGIPELREAMRLPPDAGCRLLETLVLEKGLPAQDNFTGTMISIQSINGRE